MREVQGYPLPLGVQISENKINFSIAVPTEKKCQLLIYRAGRKRLYRQFEMETAVGEVRCIALTDIEPAEYEYNYLIDGEVVVDPYVQALAGREHWGVKKETARHEIRGRFLSQEYDWEGDPLSSGNCLQSAYKGIYKTCFVEGKVERNVSGDYRKDRLSYRSWN